MKLSSVKVGMRVKFYHVPGDKWTKGTITDLVAVGGCVVMKIDSSVEIRKHPSCLIALKPKSKQVPITRETLAAAWDKCVAVYLPYFKESCSDGFEKFCKELGIK